MAVLFFVCVVGYKRGGKGFGACGGVGVWGCVGGVKWCIVGGWWEDMRGL